MEAHSHAPKTSSTPIYYDTLRDLVEYKICVPAYRGRWFRRRWWRRVWPKSKETPKPNVLCTIENNIKDDLPVATPWLVHVLPDPREDIACEDCGVSTSFSEMALDIRYILSKKGGTLKTHRTIITLKVNPWD